MIFWGLLLGGSRILWMLSMMGYYGGTFLTGLMTGSMESAFSDPTHFNYILIAMAVGGVFLIPSPKSYALAMVAVGVSTVLLSACKSFWALYGIPIFTLPFNMITLCFIYVLRWIQFPLVSTHIKSTPEATLDHYLSHQLRKRGYPQTFHLPFSGEWTVWQGFDGKWTHQGSWRYAYDFLIQDDEGKSHRYQGLELENYYAYRRPVLSPARGRVTLVINELPDNPIGTVDRLHNWGNVVMIQDITGVFVEISHFSYQSIRVAVGDWVEPGTFLGLCGNSGYSPQPHIHIQVQAVAELGGYTIPFSFMGYRQELIFHLNEVPQESEKITAMSPQKAHDFALTFMLDQTFTYEIWKRGKRHGTLTLLVKMAPDGIFYFQTDAGKLYFTKYEQAFYCHSVEGDDPYLKAFFMAMSHIPLGYVPQLQWEDYLTVDLLFGPIRRALILLTTSFFHSINKIRVCYRFTSPQVIEGSVQSSLWKWTQTTLVRLDPAGGINELRVGTLHLKRVSDENTLL